MEALGMGYPTHAQYMPKIDFSQYEGGREQAYVKHCLLEGYLPDWAYKVGAKWDSLVYVDGFAGPWQTKHPDYADSSFGIAVDALRRCQTGLQSRGRTLQMASILVEPDKAAFAALRKLAASKQAPGFGVHALCGQFVEQIPAIDQLIKKNTQNPFQFVFLDPLGWSDIPMLRLQPFLQKRSCEVLINLMTKHIFRFLGEPDRADSYQNLFGREGVLEVLQNTAQEERMDQGVREYCRSLRLLCNFKYVSEAIILEPNKEDIRYFLIYATHHPRGVEVFKAAEIKAARIQDDVRQEARVRKGGGQLEFPSEDGPPRSRLIWELKQRYADIARKKVIKFLRVDTSTEGVPYKDLFCEAMAFPLITPDDLVDWLRKLQPHARLSWAVSRRKP